MVYFQEERTTFWSFKQRGGWVTHDGKFRGNWSPFVVRNVILKYSQPGEVVLDCFGGSGTTAIEAKLLGRKAIILDINPEYVKLMLKKLNFGFVPSLFYYPDWFLFNFPVQEIRVSEGDARELCSICDESVDLVCTHPPYADAIKYSSGLKGDLSLLGIEEYLREMEKVARELYRVLKVGKKCVILIGDVRKNGYIVPLGFRVIDIFLRVGFKLRELVIKQQHNCRSTKFWYRKSLEKNFFLLAHEYLLVFEKPVEKNLKRIEIDSKFHLQESIDLEVEDRGDVDILDRFEITSIWCLPNENFEEVLKLNLFYRYNKVKLIRTPFLEKLSSFEKIFFWLEKKKKLMQDILVQSKKGEFIAIQVQDLRINGYVQPLAKLVFDVLKLERLRLKEIVILVPEKLGLNGSESESKEFLKIVHQYLLIYEVI